MERVEQKKPLRCAAGPFTSASLREALSVIRMMVASCYGPYGRLKQIHNGSGGGVTTTSQSTALLGGMSLSHPALQLLVASIRNHISAFSDCGLFAAILCCSLTDRCMSLPVSTHKVIQLNKRLLDTSLSYLKSEDCACKINVDFTHSKSILDFARSVLSSKPACMMTVKEVDYVSLLIVQAFLHKVPDKSCPSHLLGRTLFVTVEGPSVMESAFIPGVLIEEPAWTRVRPSSGLPSTNIKLALFSMSLCGELGDTGEGTMEVMVSVDPENVMLDQLIVLGKRLVDDHVQMVVCQKVIHPSLKQYLKEHCVLAVDRLGAALMEPLSQMTGAQPIASLCPVSHVSYGSLKQINKASYGNKHYLHLLPSDTTVCSIVLCNRNETSVKELTRTCQTAEHTLNLLLKDPWLLLGGGCTEAHIAAYIRYKSSIIHRSHLEDLRCTASEYKLVADCFCASLEAVARSLEHDGGETLTDLQDGHVWSIPPEVTVDGEQTEAVHTCGCQLLQRRDGLKWSVLGSPSEPFSPRNRTEISPLLLAKEPLVLDSLTAKCNGIRVAVDTAGLILDLAYIVKDEN
ncbi:McKusick-Kaufman/Bardet-Biedl syndromes putative chaperonin [Bufo bufo]|uniref:McKusick-Kaufman/Bardet-Biedl syndromes putative chaperonin n=1 Tax=Bufo bufo TaxID=8384 RepID=UPI001ABE25D9|nr:McKusick-Kaufman/Bardet-Biedl syndromes putative chaperonin [Bufo bufo]XP_040285825.1 McKusick-Kaufman/Bardet-Biedl syndromes putative chaperonin [Bufo bufo]XP_040285826.1 McKusick-Kaufman/Bardet-Biedl syndromes putative chaperonin [Bufo bufo]XP_040285827.1 McKusick-Kaufman/Bardet-Biedl syndromes putative chaperonin [Bufo bufo]XP_040285829.1 McKusick-Kaufman/Bardet-Biedl syndromes putative chaperonin [Bufo bufo]